MVGSIERLRRRIPARNLAPMMLLVIGVPGTDPIAKRVGGTAGVIAIPASPASSSGTRGDLLSGDGRRDTRAERGRVLYAPGHAPRDTTALTPVARPTRKPTCVEVRALRGKSRNPAPTS